MFRLRLSGNEREMNCTRCGRKRKTTGDEGWVTVLGSETSPRQRYCPGCLANLVRAPDPHRRDERAAETA